MGFRVSSKFMNEEGKDTGVEFSYVRIVSWSYDIEKEECMVTTRSYGNKTLRDVGKAGIGKTFIFPLAPADCDNITREQLYTQLKTLPEFVGAVTQ